MRQGLRGLIDAQPDLCVVGEAETGAGALRCIALITPSLIVLDLQLPDISGLDVLAAIAREQPKARVLIFSSLLSDLFAAAVVKAGATAYVSKGANSDAILTTLRSIVHDIRRNPEGRQWQ